MNPALLDTWPNEPLYTWTPGPSGSVQGSNCAKGSRGPSVQGFIVPSSSGVQVSQESKWSRVSIVMDSWGYFFVFVMLC